MTARRVHIYSLGHGDLFRFTLDGDPFRVVVERDSKGKAARYLAEYADGREVPKSLIEHGGSGCFVYPIESESEES